MGLSNVETILEQGVAGEPITVKPQSRVEKLLIDLINQGGGGGTTNYNALDNKPQIAGTTLQGDKSLADLGIASEDAVEDIYAVMGEMGAKNLIPSDMVKTVNSVGEWTGDNTYVNSGITWEFNPTDGTVTAVSGTATADSTFYYTVRNSTHGIDLKASTYTLSGCPDGGTIDTYKLYINSKRQSDNVNGEGLSNYGGENSITYSNDMWIGCFAAIIRGYEITTPITFKPMLRLASDIDDTYQRYAKTNKQLTDEIANKVDKVEGKGLSTNDYTDEDKAIVANVEGKAEKTVMASGEALALVPTSEGKALIHTAYGMSVQNGTPTPSNPVDIVNAKANFISTDGENTQNVTTDLTLRAIEVTSSDAYNLVRDGKYYIADTLDYSEDNGFVVTKRIEYIDIDGTETGWLFDAEGTTKQRFSLPNFYQVKEVGLPVDALNCSISNEFTNTSNAGGAWGTYYFGGTNPSYRYIVFNDGGSTHQFNSLSDFTTWLTNNPTYIDYILATPTTESITTEQALALLSLKTYDESTSISSQADPSCTVAIEYAKERLGALTLIAHNLAKGNDLRIAELEETP